jgi:hypothetical protein
MRPIICRRRAPSARRMPISSPSTDTQNLPNSYNPPPPEVQPTPTTSITRNTNSGFGYTSYPGEESSEQPDVPEEEK